MSYIHPGIAKIKKILRPARQEENNLDLKTNDNAFEEHLFEEDDEEDEPQAKRKIKINTPVVTSDRKSVV